MKYSINTPSVILAFLLCVGSLTAQIEVKDNSKVGVIVTGSGNSLNVTQIFGKSPEYAELKNRIIRLDTLLARKIGDCRDLEAAKLTKLFANCQRELGDLNIERDSVAKIEKQFREDVLRLAETFDKTPINSERLRKAKALFDEGHIRDVQFVMNDKEMTAEGEPLLYKKERLANQTHENDSLLQVKADEFRVKAQAKAADYADPLRLDSTIYCFRQSLRYSDDPQTLDEFAKFYKDNQFYDTASVYSMFKFDSRTRDFFCLFCSKRQKKRVSPSLKGCDEQKNMSEEVIKRTRIFLSSSV